MLAGRYDLGLACLGGPLYAIGGIDGRAILNTIERLDLETSEWSYVTSMINPRCGFGATAFDHR